MNKVIMIGRLTSNPDVRYTQNQTPVANFRIAVRRIRKQEDGPDADFFSVVAWGRIAEIVRDYCQKGRQVAISGRLQNRSWEDRDGNTRYTTEIIVEGLELLAQPSTQQTAQTTEDDYGLPSELFEVTDTVKDEDFPPADFIDDDELPF